MQSRGSFSAPHAPLLGAFKVVADGKLSHKELH